MLICTSLIRLIRATTTLIRPRITGCPKKITRFGNRAKQDLKSSKWHNNTSMDALDNGESEIAGFKLTERITFEHYNVLEGASFLTSPSHTFFETYF